MLVNPYRDILYISPDSLLSHYLCGHGFQNRSFIRDATVLKLPYTLPGGLPRMRLQTASLATWMFLNPPSM